MREQMSWHKAREARNNRRISPEEKVTYHMANIDVTKSMSEWARFASYSRRHSCGTGEYSTSSRLRGNGRMLTGAQQRRARRESRVDGCASNSSVLATLPFGGS
jgi:hypothetical protein